MAISSYKPYFCGKQRDMRKYNDEIKNILRRYEQGSEAHKAYFDTGELLLLVDHYFESRKLQQAKEVASFGLGLHPNDMLLQLRYIKIHFKQGYKKEAMQMLDSKHWHSELDYVLLRGELLVDLRRIPEAEECFARALKSNSDELVDIAIFIVKLYMQANLYQQCFTYLQAAIKVAPKNRDLLFQYALCYESTGQHDKSIEFYNRIINLKPYSIVAWIELGYACKRMRKWEEANQAFDYVATISNKAPAQLWREKSFALMQLGRNEDALVCCLKYYELTDCKAHALIALGEIYEQMGDFENALSAFEKSLIEEESLHAYSGAIICSLETGNYQKSIEYSYKALKIDKKASDILVYLAEAYILQNNYDKAIIAYKKSLKIDEYQIETLISLANLYFDKCDYNTAKKLYLKACRINKNENDLLVYLGATYYHLGERKKALRCVKEAVKTQENATTLFFDICPEYISDFEDNIKNDFDKFE